MAYTSAQIAVAKESWDFWKSVGCDDVHAAAWLGNEDGETSFIPKAMGDAHSAVGPFQWHSARYLIMAKAPPHGCGIDIRTASHLDCLKAAYWESTNKASTYRKVWPAFIATTAIDSPKDENGNTVSVGATEVLVRKFEQSGSQDRDISRRTLLSHYWLGKFETPEA